jgi:hypothetical protein
MFSNPLVTSRYQIVSALDRPNQLLCDFSVVEGIHMAQLLSAVTNPFALAGFALAIVAMLYGRTKSAIGRRRVFALAVVCVVGGLSIAALQTFSETNAGTGKSEVITQSTNGDASPNIVGDGNNVTATSN